MPIMMGLLGRLNFIRLTFKMTVHDVADWSLCFLLAQQRGALNEMKASLALFTLLLASSAGGRKLLWGRRQMAEKWGPPPPPECSPASAVCCDLVSVDPMALLQSAYWTGEKAELTVVLGGAEGDCKFRVEEVKYRGGSRMSFKLMVSHLSQR